jgi:hypothetical protein
LVLPVATDESVARDKSVAVAKEDQVAEELFVLRKDWCPAKVFQAEADAEEEALEELGIVGTTVGGGVLEGVRLGVWDTVGVGDTTIQV